MQNKFQELKDVNQGDTSIKIEQDNKLAPDDQDYSTKPQSENAPLYNYQDIHYRRNFGKNLPFLFRNNEPLITIGPHWPLFICADAGFTVLQIMVTKLAMRSYGIWIILLTFAVCIIHQLSYLITALKNPGICSSIYPVQNPEECEKLLDFCKKCQIVKSKGTFHCEDCDVCISQWDHHCPWTSKCIGSGNLQEFFSFLSMTCFFIVYSVMISLGSVDISK